MHSGFYFSTFFLENGLQSRNNQKFQASFRRCFGMRSVRTISSSVSSRSVRASTPASRISRSPRSTLFKNNRTSLMMYVRRPRAARSGGRQPPLYILLRLGHIPVLRPAAAQGGQPLALVLQPQQAAGVTLRQSVFHQQRPAGRGQPQQPQLVGQSRGGHASWACTASWVMPVWWRKAAMASASSR